MPARLKSFELHGYKTFASRTEFIFADGITAIVGPNGSGKSNIADALRWVLGEQSYSLLRAKKTEDMIFAGSEHRPRAGMASATIVFDNSDGWLPIDFSEVGITRRSYRDGDNEYLLNGQRVRLKDVSELLAQSGLAERTYTVIGQGLVDAALSLKAEERRRLFEEAAGIGLHRSRKEEALRRLETTRRNLERVQDILAELQPRLRSLERQARRAQEYDQVKADLRQVLREWYGYHWHRSQTELMEAQEAARQQEVALESALQAQGELDKKMAEFRGKVQILREQLGGWHRQLSALHARREELTREKAVTEERVRSLYGQQQATTQEFSLLEEELTLFTGRIVEATAEHDHLSTELEEARSRREESQQLLQARRNDQGKVEKDVQSARQAMSSKTARQTFLEAQLAERQAQIKHQEGGFKEASLLVSKLEQSLFEVEARLQSVIQRLSEVEKTYQTVEVELQALRSELTNLEISKKELQEKRLTLHAEITRRQAHLEVLRQAENNLSGYADGARVLLQAMREARLEGARGVISSQIEVPVELETAIAVALGEYVDAILLDKNSRVDRALDILGHESARGTLVPLDSLTPPRSLKIEIDKAPGGREAILGIASDLVKASQDYLPAIDVLLGHVVVVRDRTVARRILDAGDWRNWPNLRIVTLRGELFYASGLVLAGSTSRGILNRPRQLREIQGEIDETKQRLVDFDEQLKKLDDEITQMRLQEKEIVIKLSRAREEVESWQTEKNREDLTLEKARRSMQWQQEQNKRLEIEIIQGNNLASQITAELHQLEKEISLAQGVLKEKSTKLESLSLDEFLTQVAHWTTRTAVTERAVTDARNRILERQSTLEHAQRSRQLLLSRLDDFTLELGLLNEKKTTLQEEKLITASQISALSTKIDPAEAELVEVEKAQSKWISLDVEGRQELSVTEHHHAQVKILLARRQESLDSLRRRIEDDFGLVAFDYADTVSGPKPLPLDGMVEELPHVTMISQDLDEVVQRQRALLRRMGAVNPEAQSEYKQVKERFNFLTEQVSDLHKAEIDIREVITELDMLMEREFRKTFDAVAHEFRQIFTRLFGGGSARLVLTDPEDLSDTGIDIEARLPGRREQGLSLLSGGERSLTATALVFALLRISPTPFCIFDEVDAMLDEANVSRFRDLLSELSQHTQFIVVTHNRNTVQAASVIYGVTMGRDSASQVISLKLDEVSEEYSI